MQTCLHVQHLVCGGPKLGGYVRREKPREMLVEQAKCGASGGHGIKPGRKMCTAPIPSCLFPISFKNSKSKLVKKEDKSAPRDKKPPLSLSPCCFLPFGYQEGTQFSFIFFFTLLHYGYSLFPPFRSNQLMEQIRDTTKTRARHPVRLDDERYSSKT